MIISSINNVSNIKNYRQVKNSKQQNQIRTEKAQKTDRNLLDYPKGYRPSFGSLEVALMFCAMCGANALYNAIKGQIGNKNNLGNIERLEEEQHLITEHNRKVSKIANKLQISKEEAEKYHDKFLKIAAIKPKGDGNEIGLNSVMGYGVEKYKLAVDFITPIIAKDGKMFITTGNVPNGLLMYGPPGSGKTYMATKTCEHLKYHGIQIINIKLSPNNHEENAEIITNAFENGKERFRQTGKYTVINFTQDIDNIFTKRNISTKNIPEISAFLDCADKCAEEGVTWIGTANEPQQLDTAVLRAGRTDIKMPIGEMKNFAVADMINYSLIKYGQKTSIEDFDFSKVIDEMKEKEYVFTPSELDTIVEFAVSHKMHPDMPLTADMLISEMKDYNENEFPTLTDDEIQRFEENQNYIDCIESAEEEKI